MAVWTVGQLRAALASLPQDLPVSLEGCDCYGDLAGVSTMDLRENLRSAPQCWVLLRRADGGDDPPWLLGAPAMEEAE